jgi:hypothetical protein
VKPFAIRFDAKPSLTSLQEIMKTTLSHLLLILGLLLAFAVPGRAEESHRGFFEADLAGGGKAVFFVQGNHALSVYIFNVSSSTAGFAGGNIADDGSFSVLSDTGVPIAGSIHDDDQTKSDDD